MDEAETLEAETAAGRGAVLRKASLKFKSAETRVTLLQVVARGRDRVVGKGRPLAGRE